MRPVVGHVLHAGHDLLVARGAGHAGASRAQFGRAPGRGRRLARLAGRDDPGPGRGSRRNVQPRRRWRVVSEVGGRRRRVRRSRLVRRRQTHLVFHWNCTRAYLREGLFSACFWFTFYT